MMRIAVDMQSTLGQMTGIGHYARHLLAALRRLAPQHEFAELDWGRDPPMRIDRRLRWQQFEVPRRARAARASLLHVPGFDGPLWRPVPLVVTVHDLIGMLFPRNFPPVSRLYWSRWLPFSLRFAHAILADSESTRRDLLRLTPVRPERITVAPLGVEPHFRPQPAEQIGACRAHYGLDERYLLYVGTLEPRKGVDILLEAFASLGRGYTGCLALVGKRGWRWAPLLERVDRLGLAERVRVLDYVPAEDLPRLYAGADLCVLPSRYEGFGLPVLEAMACGTPVVCSRVSSLPEVGGEAAYYAPPGDAAALADALLAVLEDPSLAATLRQRGLEQAAQFTWDRTARLTLAVYEQAAAHAHHR